MTKIRELSDLTSDIYQESRGANAEHGLSYIDLSAYLAEQAAAGEVSEDLVRIDPNSSDTPRNADGSIISPVRQMLAHSGIRLSGLNASTCSVFMESEREFVPGANILFPAFTQEIYEQALGIRTEEGFTSRPGGRTDDVYPQPTRPGVVDERPDDSPRMVTLNDLVVARVGIEGDTYRAITIAEDARDPEQYGFSRVAERGTFPTFTIALGDLAIRIYKRGAAVEASYEAMRRMKINLLQLTLQEIAYGENRHRVNEGLLVLVNGDGNANPAIDTEVAAAWTVKILDEYLLDVSYDHLRDIRLAVGDLTEVKAIRALRYPTSGLDMTPDQLAMYRSNGYVLPDGTPLRVAPKGSVLDDSGKLLALASGLGLLELVENGSQIEETRRFIENQTQKWTMSVNLGYQKLQRKAALTATRDV